VILEEGVQSQVWIASISNFDDERNYLIFKWAELCAAQ